MKKTIYTVAITNLMAVTVLVGCQTSTKKEDDLADARENTEDAKEALMLAKKEATAEDWKKFKEDTNIRITENEKRIAELKVKMKKTGDSIDAMHAKKIDELEQKNKEIKVKVNRYKNDTSDDLESFKREYNHNMAQLRQALKDMIVDNKK